jgi:hypothetical protein
LIHPTRLLSASSARMLVESFKLMLLPIWMTKVIFNGRENVLLINGQSGVAQGDVTIKDEEEKSPGGLLSWLEDLLDDDQ